MSALLGESMISMTILDADFLVFRPSICGLELFDMLRKGSSSSGDCGLRYCLGGLNLIVTMPSNI